GTGSGSVQRVAFATVAFASASDSPADGNVLGNSVQTESIQAAGKPTSGPSAADAAERTLDQLLTLAIPSRPRSRSANARADVGTKRRGTRVPSWLRTTPSEQASTVD